MGVATNSRCTKVAMWKTVHVLKWYTLIVDMGVATNSTRVLHEVLVEAVSEGKYERSRKGCKKIVCGVFL